MKLGELLSLIESCHKEAGTSKPYICGGTPRDKVLNRISKISDLDITTGDKSIRDLAIKTSDVLGKKYNIDMSWKSDGHASLKFGNLKIDFSSNFILPSLDNYIKVESSLDKEMYSRDFTCNSLLLDFNLSDVTDPTNKGLKDISNKVIDTCLDPSVTLTSFQNRVVRILYLASKLNFEVSPRIIEWVKNNPKSLLFASKKSLKEKLELSFKYDKAKTEKLIKEMNLIEVVKSI